MLLNEFWDDSSVWRPDEAVKKKTNSGSDSNRHASQGRVAESSGSVKARDTQSGPDRIRAHQRDHSSNPGKKS